MTKLFLFFLLAVAPLLAGEASQSGVRAFFVRYSGSIPAMRLFFSFPPDDDLLIIGASNAKHDGYFEIAVHYKANALTADPPPQILQIRKLYGSDGVVAYIPVRSGVVVESIACTYLAPEPSVVFEDNGNDAP